MNDLEERAWVCAQNNADWHEAMFSARQIPSNRNKHHWQSLSPPPAYHSNLVILDSGDNRHHLKTIRAIDQVLDFEWSLKDSFSRLELEKEGFAVLFAARWIWREPIAAATPDNWKALRQTKDLHKFVKAWRGTSPHSAGNHFPDAMLHNTAVTFHARSINGEITAGCVSNRSKNATGFSNFFVVNESVASMFAEATQAVQAHCPDVPVVGYERGGELQAAIECGFQAVGPLRIWQKQRPQSH